MADNQRQDPEGLFVELASSPQGLPQAEAQSRLARYGANTLEEKKLNPLLKLLRYFWGPIPWMIEVAAILSALAHHWVDLVIILILLVFNAGLGFWQEFKAANSLEALKKQLALTARVRRDGKWQVLPAEVLVPGDVIRLRAGDIIPADVLLFEGDFLSVDQSALTGESLPVSKEKGEACYAGSVARQGEMLALVTATGNNSFFGRTASLVQKAGAASHFQKAVLHIGNYLIYLSLGLIAVLIVVQLERGDSPLSLVQFALILTVASIPVAMPAVLSVTMAVGCLALAKMKAIVTRLESIEEMAGIDILCSDKTGTLTQNRLTLGEPVRFGATTPQELILAGALAAKEEDQDPIDLAIIGALPDKGILQPYRLLEFLPFDPVHKRIEAKLEDDSGRIWRFTKGAPQVVLALCQLAAVALSQVQQEIDTLAAKGYRTLGVARAEESGPWQFLGLLPLFDPPREDSAATIAEAQAHGIRVKMVTGDNVAIGRQIAQQLGLGTAIQPVTDLFPEADGEAKTLSPAAAAEIDKADGYAQVFPEHKYLIVKALQERGHLVGMTGDGVNDAPALKQADVGIAVSGATDAARAAADLVLTEPGLSVIIRAVEEARRIFERMNSYAIYRIMETIRIMFFVVLAIIFFNFYPITAIMIILLALFNDVPIMAIAFDHTLIDPQPVRWQMHRVLTVATVLGLIGVAGSFVMLIIAKNYLHFDVGQIQTFIFLKMAVAGHLTLFVTRTPRFFLAKPHPAPLLFWSAVATKLLATLFVVYPFGLITPISWRAVGIIWAYCLAWLLMADLAKLAVSRQLALAAPHHRTFLAFIKQRLNPYT